MEWLVVILTIVCYIVSVYSAYKGGHRVGYKEGSKYVLDEWKQHIKEIGEEQ